MDVIQQRELLVRAVPASVLIGACVAMSSCTTVTSRAPWFPKKAQSSLRLATWRDDSGLVAAIAAGRENARRRPARLVRADRSGNTLACSPRGSSSTVLGQFQEGREVRLRPASGNLHAAAKGSALGLGNQWSQSPSALDTTDGPGSKRTEGLVCEARSVAKRPSVLGLVTRTRV
jgi:hypothetical protein